MSDTQQSLAALRTKTDRDIARWCDVLDSLAKSLQDDVAEFRKAGTAEERRERSGWIDNKASAVEDARVSLAQAWAVRDALAKLAEGGAL